MQIAIDIFRDGISRSANLHQLYVGLRASLSPVIDPSDILRSELALTVSALDHFVHELAVRGMLEIWVGNRPQTLQFQKFSYSADSISNFISTSSHTALEVEIRRQHGHLSFQQPDRIADAIRLFSPVELWDEVGNKFGRNAKDIKSELALIVDRRNKIVHEADIDPTYPGQRWPIFDTDTELARNFVSDLGEVIFDIVT